MHLAAIGIDDIKLVPCDDCDLVRYCSDECREDHKADHEEACKKRAAELRDELLFKQPESSYLGDCPICFLPLPLNKAKSDTTSCCSKYLCVGCLYANAYLGVERTLCPFCREPIPDTEEGERQRMKRVEANDPVAIRQLGIKQFNEEDYSIAFENFSKAAELGDAEAHFMLASMYRSGDGVDMDNGKTVYHWEEAAIRGHPAARCSIGIHEWFVNSNAERGAKHFIIAATQGDDLSITSLMSMFRNGFVEKEKLAAALRAHKAAVDATKSPQREAASLVQHMRIE